MKKVFKKTVSLMIAALMIFVGAQTALAAPVDFYDEVPEQLSDSPQDEFDMLTSLGEPEEKEGSDFSVKAVNVTSTEATLKWRSKTVVFGYEICRFNFLINEWEPIITTTKTEYKFTGLKPNTSYRYCFSNAVTGESLGIKEFTTGMVTPSVFIKQTDSDKVEIGIKNAQKHSKIYIYRKAEGEKYEKIAAVNPKSKSYVDETVEEGTTYFYKAKAVVVRKKKGKKIKRESGESRAKKTTTLIKLGLPKISGRVKSFAYYTACNIKNTPQYRLLNSKDCYTDPETGVRMVEGCYCVAMGSYYGSTMGTKYRITFSTGTQIDVILCDQKADIHTDKNNQYGKVYKDILEFYCEKEKVPKIIKTRGNFNNIELFSGDIVAIEQYVEGYTIP